VITDDQVVALLRDAGSAGPLPRPLDPRDVVSRSRAGRTRTLALAGLGTALAAVVVLTEPGRVLLAQAASGGTSPQGRGLFPGLLPAVLLLVVIVASAVATPVAARLPEEAGARRALAAVWGVLAILVAGLFSEWGGVFLVPSRWEFLQSPRPLQPIALMVLAPTVVAAGALLARRVLRPSSMHPVSGAVWLSLSLMSGWALASLAYLPVSNPAPGTTDVGAVVALAAGLAVAVALGAAAYRRLPPGSPWRRAAGLTLLVAATGAATILCLELWSALGAGKLTLARTGGVVWLAVAAVILVGLALLGARLAFGSAVRTWVTAVLAVAVVPLAVQSGQSLISAMQPDVKTGVVHPAPGLLWACLLAILAVTALVLLDRRTSRQEAAEDAVDRPVET
jgi:hypothetical protein